MKEEKVGELKADTLKSNPQLSFSAFPPAFTSVFNATFWLLLLLQLLLVLQLPGK